jgi:hypothetical protein
MPRHIFLIFVGVGLAIAGASLWFYVSGWLDVAEARRWPITEGTVRALGVEDRVSRDSEDRMTSTFHPRILYSYRVGGRTFGGERIWLVGNDFYNDRGDAVAFVARYAVGQRVPVHYDAELPGRSALILSAPPWWLLLFTLFGLFWIAAAVWFRRMGDPSRPKSRRVGRCRGCGARLAFADHLQLVASEVVTRRLPAGAAHAGSSTHQNFEYRHTPCPSCGEAEPLKSLRNAPELVVFLLVFAAIWAGGLYLVFFA